MVSFSATYAQRAPWYGLFSEVFNSCDWVKLGLHLGHGGSSLQGHKLPFTLTLTAHLELFVHMYYYFKSEILKKKVSIVFLSFMACTRP